MNGWVVGRLTLVRFEINRFNNSLLELIFKRLLIINIFLLVNCCLNILLLKVPLCIKNIK